MNAVGLVDWNVISSYFTTSVAGDKVTQVVSKHLSDGSRTVVQEATYTWTSYDRYGNAQQHNVPGTNLDIKV